MDRQDSSERLDSLTKSFSGALMGFSLTFLNKKLGGIRSETEDELHALIGLREGLRFRVECALFHSGWLKTAQENWRAYLGEDPFNQEKQVAVMTAGGDRLLCLFDGLVYHTMSAFEYCGNIAGYSFYGQPRSRMKWKGLMLCCTQETYEARHYGKDLIWNSNCRVVAEEANRDLVSWLEEYRANLFHYTRDSAKRSISIPLFEDQEVKIKIDTPKEFTKWATKGGRTLGAGEMTLVEAARWLNEESLRLLAEMLIALDGDVLRVSSSQVATRPGPQ